MERIFSTAVAALFTAALMAQADRSESDHADKDSFSDHETTREKGDCVTSERSSTIEHWHEVSREQTTREQCERKEREWVRDGLGDYVRSDYHEPEHEHDKD